MAQVKKSGIYRIVNTSGECYVGQSENVWKRMRVHRMKLTRGSHEIAPLQKAFDKSPDDFQITVIEFCPPSKLNEREAHWIWELKPVYNRTIPNPHWIGETIGIDNKTRKRLRTKVRCIDCRKRLLDGDVDRCGSCSRTFSIDNIPSGWVKAK